MQNVNHHRLESVGGASADSVELAHAASTLYYATYYNGSMVMYCTGYMLPIDTGHDDEVRLQT